MQGIHQCAPIPNCVSDMDRVPAGLPISFQKLFSCFKCNVTNLVPQISVAFEHPNVYQLMIRAPKYSVTQCVSLTSQIDPNCELTIYIDANKTASNATEIIALDDWQDCIVCQAGYSLIGSHDLVFY